MSIPSNKIKYKSGSNGVQIDGMYQKSTGEIIYAPVKETAHGIGTNSNGVAITKVTGSDAGVPSSVSPSYNFGDIQNKTNRLYTHNDFVTYSPYYTYMNTFSGKAGTGVTAGHCWVTRDGHAIGYVYYELKSGYDGNAGRVAFYSNMPPILASYNTIIVGSGKQLGAVYGLESSITSQHELSHYCEAPIVGTAYLYVPFSYISTYTG